MARIYKFLPDAKYVFLTEEEVGNKGDMNDFVVKYGKEKTIEKLKSAITIEEGHVDNMGITYTTKEDIVLKFRHTVVDRGFSENDEQWIQSAKNVAIDTILEFKNKKAICPFHNDTNESLMLLKEKNAAKCFVCGEYCGSISIAMKLRSISFLEAVKYLAGDRPKTYNEVIKNNII
jgi:hypothetical protein